MRRVQVVGNILKPALAGTARPLATECPQSHSRNPSWRVSTGAQLRRVRGLRFDGLHSPFSVDEASVPEVFPGCQSGSMIQQFFRCQKVCSVEFNSPRIAMPWRSFLVALFLGTADCGLVDHSIDTLIRRGPKVRESVNTASRGSKRCQMWAGTGRQSESGNLAPRVAKILLFSKSSRLVKSEILYVIDAIQVIIKVKALGAYTLLDRRENLTKDREVETFEGGT